MIIDACVKAEAYDTGEVRPLFPLLSHEADVNVEYQRPECMPAA